MHADMLLGSLLLRIRFVFQSQISRINLMPSWKSKLRVCDSLQIHRVNARRPRKVDFFCKEMRSAVTILTEYGYI